jgi:thioredoxin reductase (NADPH)
MFRDKTLVIIGGGDTALEESTHLTHFAAKVIILVRRDAFRASVAMQERVKSNPKIEIMRNTEAVEAVGDKFLTGVKVVNNKTKEEKLIECAGLFYAVGHQPNTAFLQEQIQTDEVGYIVTKPGTTETNVP